MRAVPRSEALTEHPRTHRARTRIISISISSPLVRVYESVFSVSVIGVNVSLKSIGVTQKQMWFLLDFDVFKFRTTLATKCL